MFLTADSRSIDTEPKIEDARDKKKNRETQLVYVTLQLFSTMGVLERRDLLAPMSMEGREEEAGAEAWLDTPLSSRQSKVRSSKIPVA